MVVIGKDNSASFDTVGSNPYIIDGHRRAGLLEVVFYGTENFSSFMGSAFKIPANNIG